MEAAVEIIREEMKKINYSRYNTRKTFLGYVIYKPEEDLGWDGLTFTNQPPNFLIFNTEEEGIEYMKAKVHENGDFYHIFHFSEVAKLYAYSTLKVGEKSIFGVTPEYVEKGFFLDRIYDGNY